MPVRLAHALILSIALHLLAFGTADWLAADKARRPTPTPAVLEAILRPVPELAEEKLLKDTIAASQASKPRPQPRQATTELGPRRAEHTAERKLAAHVYYPEEAITRGLEGEVRLLITLDERGAIIDAQIAASSGHAILDQAALHAAETLGRLTGIDRREIILPVRFQLH